MIKILNYRKGSSLKSFVLFYYRLLLSNFEFSRRAPNYRRLKKQQEIVGIYCAVVMRFHFLLCKANGNGHHINMAIRGGILKSTSDATL